MRGVEILLGVVSRKSMGFFSIPIFSFLFFLFPHFSGSFHV